MQSSKVEAECPGTFCNLTPPLPSPASWLLLKVQLLVLSDWVANCFFVCYENETFKYYAKLGRDVLKTSLTPAPTHRFRPSWAALLYFTNPFLAGCNNEERIMQYLNNPSQFLVAWPRLPGACSLERSGGHFGFVSWDWSLVCCCSTEEQPSTPSSWTMDIAEWRVRFPPSIFKPSRFDL